MDSATSTNPAVQRQLDRLTMLSPGRDILGLERITTLLARLGDPHLRLPPVFHVAGTNGKGSTCAFLRAALEAAGYRVHAYTSPHLVRFNERIRLAGVLIEDRTLAPLLEEVLSVAADLQASFFEVTTAAAFLAFSRSEAEACVIEVGLGGRLDATNVFPAPAVTGIAQLGIDHQAFLGDRAEQIAAEKAGIARRGVPLVTLQYPPEIAQVVAEVAARAGAPVMACNDAWCLASKGNIYEDVHGALALPAPALPGAHQRLNAGLATAMLRHQTALAIPGEAIATGLATASWPARLQHLSRGVLVDRLPAGAALLLDGGHNPDAARALAAHLAGQRVTIIFGMLANKDLSGFLTPLAPVIESLIAVPIPGHEHYAPEAIASAAQGLGIASRMAGDIGDALRVSSIRHPGARWGPSADDTPDAERDASVCGHGEGKREFAPPPHAILIAGSLYLAGLALAANGTPPD